MRIFFIYKVVKHACIWAILMGFLSLFFSRILLGFLVSILFFLEFGRLFIYCIDMGTIGEDGRWEMGWGEAADPRRSYGAQRAGESRSFIPPYDFGSRDPHFKMGIARGIQSIRILM